MDIITWFIFDTNFIINIIEILAKNYREIKMLLQLVAYSGTGKDTLYKKINSLEKLGWMVYGPVGEINLKFPTEDACRIALGDNLKLMVCQVLNMDKVEDPSTINSLIRVKTKMTPKEWVEGGYIDLLKDLHPNEVNLPLEYKTVRQWLIDYGWEKKTKYGKTYFVDLVNEDVKNKLSKNIHVFITDTRYPYEVFENAITIRLFRSDVSISDESVDSERSMDKYKCSYVFCKNDEDFNILKDMQPQYKEYTNHGNLKDFVHIKAKELCGDALSNVV